MAIDASALLSEERCPFCFPAAISPRQLLVAGEHFYLLAPAGQLVEGFLGIFTHQCGDGANRLRCLDEIPSVWLDELRTMSNVIIDFYHESYRSAPLFYEHGRGGGGDSCLPGAGFVFHPHLCALPGALEVHAPLLAHLTRRAFTGWGSVRREIGNKPYLYIHTPADPRSPEPCLYVADDSDGEQFLFDLSLKKVLAAENKLSTPSDWRSYPGPTEIEHVAERFEGWYSAAFRRPSDGWLRAPSLPESTDGRVLSG